MEWIKNTYKPEDYSYADSYIGLDVFLRICSQRSITREMSMENGNIGEKIWNKTKNEEKYNASSTC